MRRLFTHNSQRHARQVFVGLKVKDPGKYEVNNPVHPVGLESCSNRRDTIPPLRLILLYLRK